MAKEKRYILAGIQKLKEAGGEAGQMHKYVKLRSGRRVSEDVLDIIREEFDEYVGFPFSKGRVEWGKRLIVETERRVELGEIDPEFGENVIYYIIEHI